MAKLVSWPFLPFLAISLAPKSRVSQSQRLRLNILIKAEWQCNGEASLLKFDLFSGSNADIKAFAASQGATFDMFAKVPTDVFETKQP